MIRWPLVLDQHIRDVIGPDDEFNDETNGDPDSLLGEEDERGFDDMPGENGWEDESDEDEDEDEDDE